LELLYFPGTPQEVSFRSKSGKPA